MAVPTGQKLPAGHRVPAPPPEKVGQKKPGSHSQGTGAHAMPRNSVGKAPEGAAKSGPTTSAVFRRRSVTLNRFATSAPELLLFVIDHGVMSALPAVSSSARQSPAPALPAAAPT
jgi:hypothetical protein